MWNSEKLANVAQKTLVEYIGVSAQFVVRDAMEDTMKIISNQTGNEQMFVRTFLIKLMNVLPAELPTEKIRQTILDQCPPSATPTTDKQRK
jgi:hypothetical protein